MLNTTEEALHETIDSKSFKQILKDFKGLQGIYGNIRGLLFEFLCCEILRSRYNYRIERAKKIVTSRGESDIDIFAEQENVERRYIECKGWKKSSFLSDDEFDRWLYTRIPNILFSLKSENIDYKKVKIKMELWITCKLTDEQQAKIDNFKNKRCEIVIKNRNDLLDMSKETGNNELAKTYQTIFFDKKGKFETIKPQINLTSDLTSLLDVDEEGLDIPF